MTVGQGEVKQIEILIHQILGQLLYSVIQNFSSVLPPPCTVIRSCNNASKKILTASSFTFSKCLLTSQSESYPKGKTIDTMNHPYYDSAFCWIQIQIRYHQKAEKLTPDPEGTES